MAEPWDPLLIDAWLRARSVVRGLPQPIDEGDRLRVDTASPDERVRYVFGRGLSGMRALADTITEPLVFLKFCGPASAMRAILPDRFAMLSDRYVMTCAPSLGQDCALPAGFTLNVSSDGATGAVEVFAPDGALAASGRCGEYFGAFIYDQIVTGQAFQRKGLGRAVMTALSGLKRDTRSVQVLVATAQGRDLYTRLGWEVRSPYATAVIPTSSEGPPAP